MRIVIIAAAVAAFMGIKLFDCDFFSLIFYDSHDFIDCILMLNFGNQLAAL